MSAHQFHWFCTWKIFHSSFSSFSLIFSSKIRNFLEKLKLLNFFLSKCLSYPEFVNIKAFKFHLSCLCVICVVLKSTRADSHSIVFFIFCLNWNFFKVLLLFRFKNIECNIWYRSYWSILTIVNVELQWTLVEYDLNFW